MVGTKSKWEDELGRWLKPFLDRLGHKARRRSPPARAPCAGLVLPAAQFSFQDLAVAILWKRLDEDIFLGPLETRDMVEANLIEFGFIDLRRPRGTT